MKSVLFRYLFLLTLVQSSVFGQTYYFPPLAGDEWATTSPEELGWCTDNLPALYDYLESEETKGFIVLVNGRIVLEKYFGSFTADSVWYWASAGKTLTAALVGLAQEEGFLDIAEPASKYLGKGWTSLQEEMENKITIRHQLTMTSGLDDGVADPFCTLPACLKWKAEAGSRWAYHNAPYTLLDEVIKNATGQNLNVFGFNRLFSKTGISGVFIKSGFNNVFYSKVRSMARFGTLMLNEGNWNNTSILKDKMYVYDAIHSSQSINPSYGYLWWLNGQARSMVPGTQIVFNRKLFLEAPDDMYSALGKNGQILNVIPSLRMVMVRMGNFTDNLPVPFLLNDEIWKRFNLVQCVTSVNDENAESLEITVAPNPAQGFVQVFVDSKRDENFNAEVYNVVGSKVADFVLPSNRYITWQCGNIPAGMYFLQVVSLSGKRTVHRIFLQAEN